MNTLKKGILRNAGGGLLPFFGENDYFFHVFNFGENRDEKP